MNWFEHQLNVLKTACASGMRDAVLADHHHPFWQTYDALAQGACTHRDLTSLDPSSADELNRAATRSWSVHL